ncbi:MAG: hypothetical protein HOK81_10825, partial [Rhodospirillaceae bacterium]|nr:hypothetical protein [Rhodospirillaceae bacterium]
MAAENYPFGPTPNVSIPDSATALLFLWIRNLQTNGKGCILQMPYTDPLFGTTDDIESSPYSRHSEQLRRDLIGPFQARRIVVARAVDPGRDR